MNRVVELDWCPECRGSGHSRDCHCLSGFEFVAGCCPTCRGAGQVPKPEPKSLWIPPALIGDSTPRKGDR